MRRAFCTLVLLAMVGVTTATAQDRADIEVTRQQLHADRQAIVAANLPMTGEQASAFWPVYREYRAALAATGDRSVALITGYAAKYGSLTDPDADAMLKEFLAIQNDRLKVQSKYVDRFKKILPGTTVARYYQIENKLDAIVNYELAAEIPLLK
jgi:hypothetical protein